MNEEREAGRDEAAIEPWKRRPGESAKAFAAFVIYRDLGSERTLKKTRECLGKKSGYGRLLEKWSSAFDWVERTKIFDAHMDTKKRGSLELETAEAAKKHVEAANAILKGALKRLKSLDPDDIFAKDLPNWVATAIKLQRQALGMDELSVKLPQGETLKIVFEEVGGDQKESVAWEELRAAMANALDGFPEAKARAMQLLEEVRQ